MLIRSLNIRHLAILVMLLLPAPPVNAEDVPESADFLYIKKAFNDGFYDMSQERLESFIKNYPQTQYLYQAHALLGRCYYRQNNYASALYEFQSILDSPAASEFQDEALYRSGDIYTRNGDFKSALEYYERVIDDFPASKYLGYAVYSKGWAYYKLGLIDEAVKCFEDIVSKYPLDKVSMEAQFRLSECLYVSGRYEKAAKALDVFIGKFPVSEKTPEAYYLNGESKYYLGKYKESIDSFERALSISPGARWAPFAVYRIGRALYELGDFPSSIGRFKKCLEMPGSEAVAGSALLGLVRNYEKSSASSEAIKICGEIIAKHPDSEILPEVYCRKIKLIYNDKKYAEAESVSKYAIARFQKSPLLAEMRYDLGRIYIMQGRQDEAIEEFARVEAETEDTDLRAGALCKIGDIYFDKKDYRPAAESYDIVLGKYSESFSTDYAQYQVANIASLSAKYDAAILAYQAILVNFPGTDLRGKVILRLGAAYFNRGDFERASGEFERFIREFPDSLSEGQARLYLANSLYNMGKYDPALAAFKLLEETASDRKIKMMAAYQIGWCWHNMRKEEAALDAFENFTKSYPDSELAPDARLWIGEHYLSKQKYGKAEKYFESILEDFPSCSITGEALIQLALTLSECGKSDEAVSRLEELANKFPGADYAVTAYRKIAKIKKDKKEFDRAIEYYRKALTDSNNETNAQTQYEIAESYEDKGDLKEAAEEYLRVPRLYSMSAFWSVRAQLKCAQAFEALDRPNDAVRLYEILAGMGVEESEFAKKRIKSLKRKAVEETITQSSKLKAQN